MVIICFASIEMRRKGLAFLLRHFSGKSWASGEVMAPTSALAYLAAEGLYFRVEGPATNDRIRALDRQQ
jgi:hypothetical protein